MERVEKMALQTALEQVTLSIRSTESIYSFCFTIKKTCTRKGMNPLRSSNSLFQRKHLIMNLVYI